MNTLFLAYAGASLPLLILFAGSPDPLGTVVTSETVAVEIVRTLVGSVGLIADVPITTAWRRRSPWGRAREIIPVLPQRDGLIATRKITTIFPERIP